MGILDLFRRKPAPLERREAGGYTAALMAARAGWIAGAGGLAEATSTVQSCISLWEAGLSLADVSGTGLLTRRTLALTARTLALRGEALFLIRGDHLIPCTDWDVATRDGEPTAYRLGIPEAGGDRRETALAGETLHFRIGVDVAAPWAGSAPLRRSQLSAQLLDVLEGALRDVYRAAPLGSQIIHVPEGSADDMAAMRESFHGRRGAALVIEGVAQATAAGLNPGLGQRPDQLSPDLERSLADRMLAEAKGGIALAFGVLPALLSPAATGPAVREAQRHLAQLVLQPIADQLAEEASAKLGGRIALDVVRPMQAFDHGGKARAFGAMLAAYAAAKEAGLDPAEIEDAKQLIDWQEDAQ